MDQPVNAVGTSHGAEDPAYLTSQLVTCIGNKRRLLPLIDRALGEARARLGVPLLASFADIFAGSGVVSRLARSHARHVFVNDIEDFAAVTGRAYQTAASAVDWPALSAAHAALTRRVEADLAPGFLTELYAPRDDARIRPAERVFYTRRNAMYLDTARRLIGEAPEQFRALLLAPLIQRASVHANTAGVFKGFYKDAAGTGQFGGRGRDALSRILAPIRLPLPVLSRLDREAVVSQQDANAFVRTLPPVDVAYFDPPYNQHPYGSNYFMLNLVASGRRPGRISRVSGIPADWTRSDYNRRGRSREVLFDALAACPARILILSYNSEGFIGADEMLAGLEALGEVLVLDTRYNAFRGSRNLAARATHVTEYTFLVDRR